MRPTRLASLSAILVVLGGLSAQSRPAIERFGRGCASSAGLVPRLVLDEVAVAGRSLRLEIHTGMPAQCLLFLGASSQLWRGQKLPLDLGRFGFAGCRLLVSPEFTLPLRTNAGGRLSLKIPGTGLGAGQSGFLQLFCTGTTGTNKPQRWHGISDGLRVEVRPALSNHTVAVLPDTQNYVQNKSRVMHFQFQANLIVLRQREENIVFVTHEGDLVQSGISEPTQWARAKAVMATLDGDLRKNRDGRIPYSVAIGNHDYDVVDDKSFARQFLSTFGATRYEGRSWFLNSSPSGLSMAQLFRAGSESYLHLGLEWNPRDAELTWAQNVLARHPGIPALLTTHAYANIATGSKAVRRRQGHTGNSGGDNSGEDVYRKLIEPYPQVFAVFCGHVSGEARATPTTLLGNPVHELLANYQSEPHGGNGWMRLLKFWPASETIQVHTVSPTYVPKTTKGKDYSSDPNSNFKLAYRAYGHRAFLLGHRVLHFRQGQDHGVGAGRYQHTHDTYVGNGLGGFTKPNLAYGHATSVHTDGDGDRDQGLLRFDNLIGTGPGQVPPRALIKQAILTFTTEGPFAVSPHGARLYRMTAAWSEHSTWNSLRRGIQIGTETVATHDADTRGLVSTTGTRSVDVTRSVQAWANGQPNLGWAMFCNGTNAWRFRSSEWGTVAERPMLTVVY